MRAGQFKCLAAVACLICPTLVSGVPSGVDDRIALSADGSTLTGTHGGGGASAGWLHNFDADSLAGIAVEHRGISNAQWTFGSLTGSMTRGSGDARYSVYGEVHEGAGSNGPKSLQYSIEAAGLIGTYFHRLSVQLEDKEIDVDTLHGNLPKLGVSYQWSRSLLTSASYAYSVSGNLGTRLAAARIDTYGKSVNFLAGVSVGQASPIVVGLVGNIRFAVAAHHLKEGYVGMTRLLPQRRGELTCVADYQDLAGSKRATLTLSYIFHVGGSGTAR